MELFGVEIGSDHIIKLSLVISLLIIGLCICIETVYFIRIGFCYAYARWVKKRIHILEKCSLFGYCVGRDVDIVLFHMNNARYLREVDLARIDFYMRTGLYDVVRGLRGHIWLGACNIRFRKFIRIFTTFKLTTKVVYWDDDNIYLEHKFVGSNGFVHAVMLSQQRVVNCSAEDVMDILLKKGKAILSKPDPTNEIKKFIELQAASKKSLNNNEIV